jgi:hypothetical protein
MSSWNWQLNVLCGLFLSSYLVADAFNIWKLNIVLKINMEQAAGIHDNNLDTKILITSITYYAVRLKQTSLFTYRNLIYETAGI